MLIAHSSRVSCFRAASYSELRATRRSRSRAKPRNPRAGPSGGAPRSTDRSRPVAAPRRLRSWREEVAAAEAPPGPLPGPCLSLVRPAPKEAARGTPRVPRPSFANPGPGVTGPMSARPWTAAASGRLSHFCYSRVPSQPKKPTLTCAASKEVWPAGRGR